MVIYSMDGRINYFEVYRSEQGKGTWYIYEPLAGVYQLYHKRATGHKTLLQTFNNFMDALKAAVDLARQAHPGLELSANDFENPVLNTRVQQTPTTHARKKPVDLWGDISDLVEDMNNDNIYWD